MKNRRNFIAMAMVAPLWGLQVSPAAAAYAAQDYRPGKLRDLRDNGQPVIVNYWASWSITCQIKRDIISDLKRDDPRYLSGLTFLDVNWDTYGRSVMAQRMKVERRSTLIALRGNDEIARIVAETDPRAVKGFLDTALSAP